MAEVQESDVALAEAGRDPRIQKLAERLQTSYEVVEQAVYAGRYQDEMAQLDEEMGYADALRDTPGAQGQQVGRVYVAANPLQHLAVALRRRKGGKEVDRVRDARQAAMDRRDDASLAIAALELGPEGRPAPQINPTVSMLRQPQGAPQGTATQRATTPPNPPPATPPGEVPFFLRRDNPGQTMIDQLTAQSLRMPPPGPQPPQPQGPSSVTIGAGAGAGGNAPGVTVPLPQGYGTNPRLNRQAGVAAALRSPNLAGRGAGVNNLSVPYPWPGGY